jgi:signal transduction histidine kinase
VQFHFRSLYWRIGLGFIACVAAVLAIQGLVFLWLMNRPDPDARVPFTLPLATALGTALEHNPGLDVRAFAETQAPVPPRAYYIVMTTGETLYFGDRRPSILAIQNVLEQLQIPRLTRIPKFWEVAPYWASPVLVHGVLRGTVSVVARDPVSANWPPMALMTVALLVVGTIVASKFIFGPDHQRLQALEQAARRLGAGDTAARAAEAGGDEVASLARTFNVMAQDLSARALQIAEMDRTRRLLLADISHELMTPLTAIRGYQEKLAGDQEISGSPARRRYLGIIGEEAQRVERIVRDLLDLARFESSAPVLDIGDVSVEGLFGRVAARHEAEAARRGVQLRTLIEAGAEIVRGDQFRLEQVLQNLAANALRHVTDRGSIGLHASVDDTEIVIRVRDTGAGIAAQHLPFIFDRFYKVEASRAGAEGSGLGLSIVKAIVERHGGTIAVESRPGVDTVFTIRLPAGSEAAALERPA